MDVRLTPEREAQLNEYAVRHGQDTATALDDVLREALDWDEQDYRAAAEAIGKGYEDYKARRVSTVKEAFDDMREKHGFPR